MTQRRSIDRGVLFVDQEERRGQNVMEIQVG